MAATAHNAELNVSSMAHDGGVVGSEVVGEVVGSEVVGESDGGAVWHAVNVCAARSPNDPPENVPVHALPMTSTE